jgi:hypothetical protein
MNRENKANITDGQEEVRKSADNVCSRYRKKVMTFALLSLSLLLSARFNWHEKREGTGTDIIGKTVRGEKNSGKSPDELRT